MHISQYLPDAINSSLDRFRGKSRHRAFTRHHCCAVSTVLLGEKGIELEGLTLELSRGGALFREACTFILERNGSPIILRLPDVALAGTVVNTRPEGYGIRFEKLIDDDILQEYLRLYPPVN